MTVPNRHLDANRHKWDRRSATYEGRLMSYQRAVQARTLAVVNPQPGQRLLDIGCGTGWAVRRAADLSDRGAEVYGIDLSRGMLVRALAGSAGYEDVRFLQASSETLPLETDFFDAAICTSSFHHYLHPLIALAEIRRVLRPGGRLHIADLTSDGPLTNAFDHLIKSREPEHVRFYSTAEYRDLFAPSGLRYVGSRSLLGPVKVHIAEKSGGLAPRPFQTRLRVT